MKLNENNGFVQTRFEQPELEIGHSQKFQRSPYLLFFKQTMILLFTMSCYTNDGRGWMRFSYN